METDLKRKPFILHYGLLANGRLASGFSLEEDIRLPGGFTIVFTDEGKAGFSFCHPADNFCKKIGIENAIKCLEENPILIYDDEDWENMEFDEKLERVDGIAYQIFEDQVMKGKRFIEIIPRKESAINNLSFDIPDLIPGALNYYKALVKFIS
jgi:hypothetical protein